MSRTRPIILLGLKGVGKTTIGKRLGDRLCSPCINIDAEIAAMFKSNCREIFIQKGEAYFRKIEREMFEKALHKLEDGGVIDLGGGGYLLKKNRVLLQSFGLNIVLHMRQEQLLERWNSWPPFCPNLRTFHRYYAERLQKLQKVRAIWLDATREDLIDQLEVIAHRQRLVSILNREVIIDKMNKLSRCFRL